MTMHMLPPMYSTTSTKRRKSKRVSPNVLKEKEKTRKLLEKLGYKEGVNNYRAPMPDYSTSKRYNTSNNVGNGYKKESNTYTGQEIIGIGTMHKSNLVPIRRDSNSAKELARMRRN